MKTRTLLRAFLIVLAIQAVAFALWPAVAGPCTRALCGIFNGLAPSPGDGIAIVHRLLDHVSASSDNMSVGIVLRNGKEPFQVPYGAGPGFYFPHSFLLALVLATPLPLRRRLKLAAIAFPLLVAVLAVRIGLIHLKLLTDATPWQALDLPAILDRVVTLSVSAFSYGATGGEFAALVIWVVLVAPWWRGNSRGIPAA